MKNSHRKKITAIAVVAITVIALVAVLYVVAECIFGIIIFSKL